MKTKVMPVMKTHAPRPQMKVKGEEIETVTEFVYLGSQIKNTGGVEEEVKRRKTLAGSAFQRLYTKLFKRQDIRLKTKLRV